ncbi:hypothetical protein AVEN_170300-1 [Araneus ventricosus]|uniref:Uncharacterized protein n=1 Tax=Araneus ventricosus TaxID=182803 RepID=A0A4Y2NTM3_ARAVE|nr:hypothetical protein AVEN_170300-1 [Araneus ventricosus]
MLRGDGTQQGKRKSPSIDKALEGACCLLNYSSYRVPKALKKAEEKARKKKAKEGGESSSKVEAPPPDSNEVAEASTSAEKE